MLRAADRGRRSAGIPSPSVASSSLGPQVIALSDGAAPLDAILRGPKYRVAESVVAENAVGLVIGEPS